MLQAYIDSHNHTKHFSIDSTQTLDELLSSALEAGLKGLAVTEHYDKDVINGFFQVGISSVGSLPHPDEWIFNLEAYFNLLEEKKQQLARSRPDFQLLTGIEIGYMPYLAEELDHLVDAYPFDCVIASVHCLDYRDIYHYPELYETGKQAAYGRYLETLVEMLRNQHNFDVLGHFDYITRYAGYEDPALRYQDFPDHFDEMFRLLVEKGKSLEINTRTRQKRLAAGLTDLGFADETVIRRYLELGGKMITLSSDAHHVGETGGGFIEAAAWLKSLGVSYLTAFQAGQPLLLPL
jgi:histidinol-phosphatase (PHP family)